MHHFVDLSIYSRLLRSKQLKMFCDRCQDILNLDILLSTRMKAKPGGPQYQRRPHHKNFADLQASAQAGCTICSLVCANPDSSSIITGSQSGQIYFFLHPNDLLFFEFDNSHEAVHSLSRSSQMFAFIRLSTNEGMCIRYKA
jgi:hypothetical protein